MDAIIMTAMLLLGQVPTLTGPPLLEKTALQYPDVNGSIEFKENQRVLNLWGTHYEMGFAHGFLLGSEIVEFAEGYALGYLVNPWDYENVLLPFMKYAFTVDNRYQEELDGLYDGILASGTDIYLDPLGRDLNADDIFASNLVAELGQLSCSATFGWGAATAADPVLSGGSAFVRDLDWGIDPTGFLNTKSIIIAFHPSLSDEKPFVSISWPGLITVLTAFNEDGVAGAINYGNHQGTGFVLPNHYTGIGFSLRAGIERRDSDGDGFETHFDIHHAITSLHTLGSFEVSLLSPFPVPGFPGAGAGAVLEVNYYGDALRDASNNMDYSPTLNSDALLAVTNHHRLLYAPVSCPRYSYQVSALSTDFAVDTLELWDIESAISNIGTHHMICFRPNLMDMYIAFNETFNGAANSNRVYYQWPELFPNH
jgi:hypothetical protein